MIDPETELFECWDCCLVYEELVAKVADISRSQTQDNFLRRGRWSLPAFVDEVSRPPILSIASDTAIRNCILSSCRNGR